MYSNFGYSKIDLHYYFSSKYVRLLEEKNIKEYNVDFNIRRKMDII